MATHLDTLLKIFFYHLLILIAILPPSLHADMKKNPCVLRINDTYYQCSLGVSGVVADKQEGDGATPLGEFQIRKIYYRPDRISKTSLKTSIPVYPLKKEDGWCDDIHSAAYNTLVKLPFSGSHENLWRSDGVYDIIAILGYNDHPPVKNKGSAIFLHIARKGYSPTAGCIALGKTDLLDLISQLSNGDAIKTSLSGQLEVMPHHASTAHVQSWPVARHLP